ncbi:hypothetical protein [Chamaesiphon polymorphus]|uniref:hypothetical protein n=1 Tax=Chamaesiphon polymorphus TaxID=2107691 RepID=UPI0015E67645|nr:hypothetical protein [Chamaesiphon polymorphus]
MELYDLKISSNYLKLSIGDRQILWSISVVWLMSVKTSGQSNKLSYDGRCDKSCLQDS